MRENIVEVAGQYYRRATWPRRIFARGIDLLFFVMLWAMSGEVLRVILSLLFIAYVFIGNGLFRRSLGKRLAGIKVIDARYGGPITPIQDFVRHRYLFFYNPLFLLLTAYDASQGCFDKPETYVVDATPVTPAEVDTIKEKPAKLDLKAMRKGLSQSQTIRDANQ